MKRTGCASCCEKFPVFTNGQPKAFWRAKLKPGENWYSTHSLVNPPNGTIPSYAWLNLIPAGEGSQTRSSSRIRITYIMLSITANGTMAFPGTSMFLFVDQQPNQAAPANPPQPTISSGWQTTLVNYDYSTRFDILWMKGWTVPAGALNATTSPYSGFFQEGLDLCMDPVTTIFNDTNNGLIASINTGTLGVAFVGSSGSCSFNIQSCIIYEDY